MLCLMWTSRRFYALATVCVAAGAALLATTAGAALLATTAGVAGQAGLPGARANRLVAARDAGALSGWLRLPPGSVRSKHEPGGDYGVLAGPAMGPPSTPDVVDLHSWWRLGGSAQAALAFIRAHPPRGSKL